MSPGYVYTKPLQTIQYLGLGLALRLIITDAFSEQLQSRVEVTTPINSWKRAQEAVHLWETGSNPYLGNIFHEFPLAILVYRFIERHFNRTILFAIVDCLTGIFLAESIYRASNRDEKKARLVLISYLLSPLAIVACAGYATSIFTNSLIATTLLLTSLGLNKLIVLPICSLLSCHNIHYATISIPIILLVEYLDHRTKSSRDSTTSTDNIPKNQFSRENRSSSDTNVGSKYYESSSFKKNLTTSLVILSISIITVIISCYIIMNNSWSFVKSTYLFTLMVQDVTPNIGMFWYFFTEVFDHYLAFFNWVIQINSFIHALPIAVTFRDDPYFVHYLTLLTTTIFQPYPSLANIAILFSLTFQWSDLFQYLKRSLVVSCACITSICLWPVFWHLWIYMGTANANFYFGATLAFTSSIILFMIDILNAKSNLIN